MERASHSHGSADDRIKDRYGAATRRIRIRQNFPNGIDRDRIPRSDTQQKILSRPVGSSHRNVIWGTGWSDRPKRFAELTTPALRATPPLRGGECVLEFSGFYRRDLLWRMTGSSQHQCSEAGGWRVPRSFPL